MAFAKIKAVFLSQTTGIVLCMAALFLIGDALYLNHVRDMKADAIDNLTSNLSDYQSNLQGAKEAYPQRLAAYKAPFKYGSLLKTALLSFKENESSMSVTGIKLIEEEQPAKPDESVVFPDNAYSGKKSSLKSRMLLISGDIKPFISDATPYEKLNEVIAQIKTDSDCQFALNKAANEMTENQPVKAPLHFEIAFDPQGQKACGDKYTRKPPE